MTDQYRNESQAVARALNAGEGKPTPALWQQQHSSGYRVSLPDDCDHLVGCDRLLADAMTHATLHRALSKPLYNVLVLRYSGDERARIEALKALVSVVGTNAGPQSKALSIGAWASPVHKSPAANYDQQDVSDRTLQAWRQQIKREMDELHREAMTAAQMALREAGLIGA